MRKTVAMFLLAALASCGGGSTGSPAPQAQAKPGYAVRMLVKAGVTDEHSDFFNASGVWPAPSADPVQSVAMQVQMPGLIALTLQPSGKGTGDYPTLQAHLDAAAAHRERIKWVYVYDEMFWEGGQIVLGALEDQIVDAARLVQQAGFKSSISLLPEVIQTPGFALKHPDAFDVIMVDVYPSLAFNSDTHGCALSENPNTNILACSVQRLRATGFKGDVWYIFQAFGDTRDENLAKELEQQRETIAVAPTLGVTGLLSFGYQLHPGSQPPLYQGKGSAIDSIVALP